MTRELPPKPHPTWRRHELAAARCPSIFGGEALLPPEAFDDVGPTGHDRMMLLGADDGPADGRNSPTVRVRMASSCAGWKIPPRPVELYDAIRAGEPTGRQRTILRMWATETDWEELVRAWAEEVYTFRELAAALHRAGITHPYNAFYINMRRNESSFRQ